MKIKNENTIGSTRGWIDFLLCLSGTLNTLNDKPNVILQVNSVAEGPLHVKHSTIWSLLG